MHTSRRLGAPLLNKALGAHRFVPGRYTLGMWQGWGQPNLTTLPFGIRTCARPNIAVLPYTATSAWTLEHLGSQHAFYNRAFPPIGALWPAGW